MTCCDILRAFHNCSWEGSPTRMLRDFAIAPMLESLPHTPLPTYGFHRQETVIAKCKLLVSFFLLDLMNGKTRPRLTNEPPAASFTHDFGRRLSCISTLRGSYYGISKPLPMMNQLQTSTFEGWIPNLGPPIDTRGLDIVFGVAAQTTSRIGPRNGPLVKPSKGASSLKQSDSSLSDRD